MADSARCSLADYLQKHGCVDKALAEQKVELLERYLRLILAHNEEVNLTSIASVDEGVVLHLEDSLQGLPEIMSAPSGPLADLGSGAGFPGVPLSVATGRPTTLIESRKKKLDVVLQVLGELHISGIETYADRIEKLSFEQGKRYSVVCARALAPLPSLLELASPLLCNGGRLVCYKSALALQGDDEFNKAQMLRSKLGMALVSWRKCLIGTDRILREIIVFEKVAEPAVRLPRNPGMAQKRPYL